MSAQETVAYLITAIHGGESVQNIVVISIARHYEMTDAERQEEFLAAIGPLAEAKFGTDATPRVSWVKGSEAKLEIERISYSDDQLCQPFQSSTSG